MRLALSLLIFSVVSYIATAQEAGENQVYYNHYPYYGPNARFLITSTTTTTTVSTSTSTVTCTKLLNPLPANCPAGRRRRGLLYDAKDHQDEQFPISPSAVQAIETTEIAPNREARAANPQMFVVSPYGYLPQDIQPGFYGSQYGSFVPFPYYGSYGQPVAGNRIFLSTILQAALPAFLKQTSTVTSTSTAFTVVTSTSIPACVPAVAVFAQCPP